MGIEALGWESCGGEAAEEVSTALRRIADELHWRADLFDPRPRAAAISEVCLAVHRALAGT